jgi:hypothetical protein
MTDAPPATPPEPPDRTDLWIDAAWLAVLAVWCGAWCLTAAARLGPTYDEPFYLEAGLKNWHECHPEALAVNGVMPLPIAVATCPLYLHERRTGELLPREQWVEHLPRARTVTLVWLAVLVLSAMRLGQAAGGPWAGRVAAGLVAADPTFLAHSALAATDVSVSAALLALTSFAYTGRGRPWAGRVLVPGFCFGTAVLCKLSALLYGGVILTAVEVLYWFESGALVRPAGVSAGAWAAGIARTVAGSVTAVAAAIALGLVLVLAVTGVSDAGRRPMAEILRGIPADDPLRPRYEGYAAETDRVPYAAAAFLFQWWHNARGDAAFLNGTHYPKGCWYYFPVLIAMKVPVPVWLLGAAALLRPRRALNPVLPFALLLLLVTFKSNLQTGVRLVLPIVALGYVAVAVGAVRAFGRCGAWAGAAAVLVVAGTSAWVWPHGLGYLNQFAGGPAAAHERVCDSNLDWGQGVPDLLAWHRANGEPPIALWYFGTDPAAWKPPFQMVGPERAALRTGDDVRRYVGPRVLAVSQTVLALHPDATPSKRAALDYLRTLTPTARTQTFVIYDFRDQPAPAP